MKALRVLSVLVLVLAGCSQSSSVNPGPTGTSNSGYEVAVRVLPSMIPADGQSQATVRVEVRDQYRNAVSGLRVLFSSTLGTLSSASAVTDYGVAVVNFRAGTDAGIADVVATAQNLSVTGQVTLTPVSSK